MKVGFLTGLHGLADGGVGPYGERLWSTLGAHAFGPGLGVAEVPHDLHFGRGPRGRPLESFLDLLHVPAQVPPPNLRVRYACTMHDVQHLHHPEHFDAEVLAFREAAYPALLDRAAHVVVSFPHVRDDLLHHFGLPPEKVTVVPLPWGHFRLPEPPPAERARFADRHRRLGDFFLYPAQTWPHKNHLRLIDAFERFAAETGSPAGLVCTGRRNGHMAAIEARLANSPVRARVRFLGIVPEAELAWLYRRCLAVVIPTLYEAGSIPLGEAMSLGVPVACSAVTSLPDTIRNPAATFDPRDPDAIAAQLCRLAQDPAHREAIATHGSRRFEELTREPTAQRLEAAWRTALHAMAG
ncbi:glycosyltransferase family 4 protein [Phycisphaera mikurensis]|uniref:glycosyltransferase family 4 protein n=1 Tax=Phycisphaera mikurensis TaxID=547188 RepID=UPI00069F3892|nr:glycosyltransferase family 1 protein [Phycisphaera mikurensis]MBB6440931.1 glycosyltransferase involved in cell wall biosynthesis [Phycisphaera mikurensis]